MKRSESLRLLITGAALFLSLTLYVNGLLRSQVTDPALAGEEKYLQKYIDSQQPNYQKEKALADGYWRRYKDIRQNRYWGRDGPMGIWGARHHYRQHGRREGRIFQPVAEVEESETEQNLAQSYWQRYRDVRESPIWGPDGELGLAGPRDHFQYIGRFQGKTWEPENKN